MDEGTLLAGRYRLVEVLGTGGMGRVWKAQDQLLDRPVAIKVLAPHLVDDERSAGRLRAEASRAAKVRHPNVVQVLDAVFDDGVAAIVLQLVEGPDLQAHVPASGLAPDDALALLDGVAAGLAAVHAAGVVHRDVTPRNVLLDEGVPRLTDFGIARSVAATSTATQTIRGSVGYLAPEQASGGEVGPAADVYALGCLATFLLTGRPPFEADSPVGVVHQHLTATPEDLRVRVPELELVVAAGVAAALAKDPADRPQDVAGFMAGIGRPHVVPQSSVAGAAASPTEPVDGGTRVLTELATTRMIQPDDAVVAAPAAAVAETVAVAVGSTVALPPDASEGLVGERRGPAARVLVMVALAVLALIAVLAAAQRGDDVEPDPTVSTTPTADPGASVAPAPTVDPEPSAAPRSAEEVVADAFATLRATLTDQRTAGAVDAEAFSKLDEQLGKLDDKLREGKARDAEDELRSFRSELAKRTDAGDVTADAEAALLAAASELEGALAGLQDTDGNGKGRGKDDDDDDD